MCPPLLLYFSNYNRLLPPSIPTVYMLHSTSMCWNYWSIYTQREEKERDAPPKRRNASPTLPLCYLRCGNYFTFKLVKRHLVRCKIGRHLQLLLLRTRKGCKHTVKVMGFDYRGTISIKSTRERPPPGGSKSEYHHSPPALFIWRQIVCYSEIFIYGFHFRRVQAHLDGIRTEIVHAYGHVFHST